MISDTIPVLIGDIGGTNSRLSIVKMNSSTTTVPETIHEDTLQSYKYDSLLSILKTYLAQFKETLNYPKLAVLGVPGPVENNAVIVADSFQEMNYTTGESFGKELGIETFIFLNDFAVNGYGIQSNMKEGEDYVMLNKNTPNSSGTIAMIGAGTGLGMGYLTKSPNQQYYDVNASEGCYQDFGPRTERQDRFMKYIINALQLTHLNVENACCGTNLPLMYLFLNEIEKVIGDKELLDRVIQAKGNKDELFKLNKEIITKGINNECLLCRSTIDFCIEIYGQIAGNFAVALFSTGGLYLFGGMSSILEPYIKSNTIFIDNFISKMTLKSILQKMPIIIVKNTNLGVKGALEYARRVIEAKKKST